MPQQVSLIPKERCFLRLHPFGCSTPLADPRAPPIIPHTCVSDCQCLPAPAPCWPVLPAADGYPTWAVVKVAGVAGQEKILIRGARYCDIAQLLAEIAAVSSLAAILLQPCVLCAWASCAAGLAAALPWHLPSCQIPAPAATLYLQRPAP